MTASELIAATILKATGKTSTAVWGDTKSTKVLALANYYIDTWQNEPDVDWSSLYDPEYELGTISATDTYDIDTDEVRKLSDTPGDVVRIDHVGGVNSTNYEIVPADELKRYYTGNKQSDYGNYCAVVGASLVFNRTFTSAQAQFGGTIKVPAYLYAEKLTTANSEVPVDIPNWLVAICAAEYVRTDIVRQNQYPNLIAEANALMQKMKDNEDAQVTTVYREPVGGRGGWL